jgi:hypothetical protein
MKWRQYRKLRNGMKEYNGVAANIK